MNKDPVSLQSFKDQKIKINDNLSHVGYQPALLPVVAIFLLICTVVIYLFAGDMLLGTFTDTTETTGKVDARYVVDSTVCQGGSSRTGGTDVCKPKSSFQIFYSYIVNGRKYSDSAYIERPLNMVHIVYRNANPDLHYVKESMNQEGIWGFVVILGMLYFIFLFGYTKRIFHHLNAGENLRRDVELVSLIVVDDGRNIATLIKGQDPRGNDEWFIADCRHFDENDHWDVVWSKDHRSYDVYCHPKFHL